MPKIEWYQWCGSDILRDKETERNVAWVQYYPDLGYRVQLWDDDAKPQGDWYEIAISPDLDAAKMIAQLNVEGTLV